ncbi:MAG: hypothetical protein RIG62_13505 [Cyclobacteriaceae bacterium]
MSSEKPDDYCREWEIWERSLGEGSTDKHHFPTSLPHSIARTHLIGEIDNPFGGRGYQ